MQDGFQVILDGENEEMRYDIHRGEAVVLVMGHLLMRYDLREQTNGYSRPQVETNNALSTTT